MSGPVTSSQMMAYREAKHEKLLGYRICMNKNYPRVKDNKDAFMKAFDKCIRTYINIPKKNFDKFEMGRYGEKKFFLPMSKVFNQNDCKWLTIGIGGDTLVEKEFKEKYPECKVFGIEPSPSQFVDFDKYGTVIPYGVGVNESKTELIIRDSENKYIHRNVSVIPMEKLLDRFLETRTVHYMTIDIEGFEYAILNELLPGRAFAEKKIDAELHKNIVNEKDAIVNIQNFLKTFTDYPSPYLPVFTTSFLVHEKVTFINVQSEECEKAFKFRKFL